MDICNKANGVHSSFEWSSHKNKYWPTKQVENVVTDTDY